MTAILSRLPIPVRDDIVFVGPEHVRIKESAIIVWIGVTARQSLVWNPAIPCFPVILDTGHTHDFSIQEHHVVRWAGLHPETLRILGHVRHRTRRLPLRAANIWLHRNVPEKRERMEGVPPQLLILPRGFTVHPSGEDNYPRLPLLGTGALIANSLHLTINGDKKWASLRTRDWQTRLMSWLS